jgi:SAM-dependent methyltransferase
MKSLFRINLPTVSVPAFFSGAKERATRLLPAPGDRRAMLPYDRYRVKKLVNLLNFKDFEDKSVLEVGCGEGDMLLEILKYKPKQVFGTDRSREAIDIARKNLEGKDVDLAATSARRLPFPEKSFDVVLAVYELQHVKDEKSLEKIIYELSRVSRRWVILVENVSDQVRFQHGFVRRPIQIYKDAFLKHRFHLRKTQYLDAGASRMSGDFIATWLSRPFITLRWLLSPLLWVLGFPARWLRPPSAENRPPATVFSMVIQWFSLPFTRSLDKVFKFHDGTAKLVFERERLFKRG